MFSIPFFVWEMLFGASVLAVAAYVARRMLARRRMWERSIEAKIAALEAQRREAA